MDNDNQNKVDSAAESVENAGSDSRPHGPYWLTAAVVGAVLTVVAWCALMCYPVASLWCGVGALVLSVAGLKVGRCCWRDIAITSVVASGVLILVHIIFTWGLDYALANL